MIAEIDREYFFARPYKTYTRLVSHLLFQGRPITTKYRNLNQLNERILSSTTSFSSVSQVKKNIYVVGLGRSGTTVFGKILSIHPDIGWLNEPKLLWHLAYPYEDIIGNYSSGKANYVLSASDANSETAGRINKLYALYLQISASKRVLDKYPEMVFRVEFLEELFPDNIYICLVRNGLDAIQSIREWSNQNQVVRDQHEENWWGKDRRKWNLLLEQVVPDDPLLSDKKEELLLIKDPLDMAAVEWITAMNAGIKFAEKFPEKFHIVHYEQLIREPKTIISKIFEICDLEPDATCINYASRILRTGKVKSEINIDPLLQPAMNLTMHNLGYE